MLGLLDDHDVLGTGWTGPPRVMPVIYDDFSRDRDLLAQAFRGAGGALFEIDPTETVLPGDPSEELLEATGLALKQLAPQLGVVVETGGGEVQVRSEPALSNNPSHNTFLAAIARALSSDFAGYPIVALAFDSDQLDELRRPVLWNLLVHQLPPQLPSTIGTFVPIVDGQVDYGLHCSGTPSVRYAVLDDSLRRRGLEQSYMGKKVETLAPDLDHPLILFLGAGASASAGIPVGDSVRNEAIRRLVGDVAGDNLAEAFRQWVAEHGRMMASESDLTAEQFASRLTLERVLREEFKELELEGKGRLESATVKELAESCETAAQRFPKGREALRSLASLHPRSVLMTVNFDWQIERDLEADFQVYASQAEFEGAAAHVRRRVLDGDPEIPILKIHGSIEAPDTLVADLEDTELGLPDAVKAAMEEVFAARERDGLPVQWAWVGCSMRDFDITQWMRGKTETDLYELWVDPLPGPTIDQFVRLCRPGILENIDKHRVTELPDVFLPALALRVEELAGA